MTAKIVHRIKQEANDIKVSILDRN